ncbi:SDR family NAD(P)-dependent oxidoreductase, partial [Actinocorallia longicatena]|uniref:SDR family NAD(P)-dependent oxidoreductase n=1 Tax=Actinocorallia longicatena TaxID=111803 RepID=UPI0031E23998
RGPRGRARAAVVSRDAAGLREALEALAVGDPHPAVVTGTAAGTPGAPVFVFSGYGSQRAGMARSLLDEEPAFAEAIDDLDGLFQEEAGLALWDLLETGRMPEGPDEIMPVLFAVQIGLARMWRSYGVVPAAVIGHSMGEIAAAVVSGRLSLADGVKVIVRRSKLMTALVGGGGMAVLGCGLAELDEYEGPVVHPAVLSSPKQTVVTGESDAIEAVLAWAEGRGHLARQVKAEGAGHSPQVEPLLPELRELLAELKPLPGELPMYTTALDSPHLPVDTLLDAGYWAANLRNPVRLADAVTAAAQDGHRTFIEINAHPILSHAVGETLEGSGSLVLHSLRRAPKGRETDDTVHFHTQVATLAVHGHTVTTATDGALIDLPLNPWRHDRHWMDSARRVAGPDGHPLLGAHVELPGEDRHAWQSTLTWDAPHLPLAVLAEMALAAGAEIEASAVHRLAAPHPLALGGPVTLSTTLADDGHVEIHSRTPAGTWTRLASADTVQDRRPWPHVLRSAGDFAVDSGSNASDVARGAVPVVVFGAGTQVEAATRGSRHYRLHPEVLDRCLSLLAAEVGEPGWIAESIAELRIFGPTHRGGHCQVAVEHTDEGVLGSVHLFTADGEPLLAATGVALVRPAELPVPLADKLVEAVWAESELPEGDGEPEGLLVVDGPGFELGPDTRNVVVVPAATLTDEALVLLVAELARTLTSQRLWLVTRDAQPVGGAAGRPEQSFLSALVRVLGFEQPGLRATLIDLSEGDDFELVRREVAAGLPDTEIAYRDGRRLVVRMAAATLPDRKPRRVVRRGGAYIITGGYGGIGLVTAQLLAERGAGRIVLSGRSGPNTDAEKVIARLRESGVDVGVVLGDVAQDGVAERLVRVASEGGLRLCGILHGAAAMADRLVAEIGEEDLHRVWSAKVTGARKLHEAAPADLDFFVVHSSAAALLGSPGQGSYAAANAAVDGLVARRRADGLAATTINWGTWAQVGGATEATVTVIEAITPGEGVEALEALLAFDRPATGVLRFDAKKAVELFPEIKRMPFYAALVEAAGTDADDDWAGPGALREMDPDDARKAIRARVRARVSTILGFDVDRLDPSLPLTELGLDSLVAVRIKSAVEHDLGLTVPPAVLLQGASVEAFEDWAAGELGIGGTAAVSERDAAYVMPRDAAERIVARMFEEKLGLERVSVVENFFELGGADHQVDEIHAALEAELHSVFDRLELFANPTAEGVADVIRSVEDEAARQTVRPLQPRGDGRPFFAAHPAGGTTGCYQQLAALIGTAQPFYGLERWEDAPSVEERASRYVEHMIATQPEGAFRLGGWSFGATLAYETARQLTALGREVEFVALFDGGVPLPTDDDADNLAHRFAGFAAYLTETYGMDVDLTYEELAGKNEDEMFALVAERAAPVMASLPPAVLHHQLTSHQDTRTLERYTYPPYDGRVILYKAPLPTPWAVQDVRYVNLDETNGLGPLCSGLEIVEVPETHHLNLLDPPGVNVIAAHLAAELAR